MSRKVVKPPVNEKHSRSNGGDEIDNCGASIVASTSFEGDPDVSSEIDAEDNIVNQSNFDVDFKIQSIQNPALRNLLDFFANSKMINANQDPTTNIVDRMKGICYNVPENKIPGFFKRLEECRKDKKVKLMYNEKQLEYSGIMLDFDIYQDTTTSQITDDVFNLLCQKVMTILMQLIKFKERREVVHIAITRRPVITHNEEKGCYKDGFHLLIPGIKVQKGVKKLLINKLISNEHIDQIFAEVVPAKIMIKGQDYQRKDFMDVNSSTVPVFFLGSSTKKGHAAYKLVQVYEATLLTDSKNITIASKSKPFSSSSVNLCYELSLNWESPNGIIRKNKYEVQEKYVNEVQEIENKSKAQDAELVRNFGLLSMNSVHDARIQEMKDLLDTLNPHRAVAFETWRNTVFAIANTSPSYKDLAEYFSRKGSNFNMQAFETLWSSAIKGVRGKQPLSLGTIHWWAKQDNPERYKQIRQGHVYNILYGMVYEGYKEGLLSHSDIATLLHRLLQHKYRTDDAEGEMKRSWYEFILDEDQHVDGELYKWRKWKDFPVSLSTYISDTLPNLFLEVFKKVKENYENADGNLSRYYKKVLGNFASTMRKLGDRSFKKNVILEAEDKFSQRGFADQLDKDPMIRGVRNGVLKLSIAPSGRPRLIQGYHNYLTSKFTTVPYIPFDPHDPITKKIIITLRNLFPDDEPDSFEFTMTYLSSTIDGTPKESMFMIMVGKGANGKSFLVELHKAAIGSTYGVKMPLSYLTCKSTNADNATPAQMQLKDASFAYYSESDRHDKLNASRVKEVTGQETLAGRKLRQDMVNFKPKCHHLVTTNFDFDIECNDHGTWRRIIYNPLKITFVDPNTQIYDSTDKNQRIADDVVTREWTEDPEIQGRYLGFMVWIHYWLYRRYKGKVSAVPKPHINFETTRYRRRQDVISAFLAQKCVKSAVPTSQFPMTEEIQKYIKWYTANNGGVIPAKGITEQFQNSQIGAHIKMTARGLMMVGHRFLDGAELPGNGEEYAMKNIFDIAVPEDNFGIAPESSDQYYERICSEFDQYKHIFTTEGEFDVDADNIRDSADKIDEMLKSVPKFEPRKDNINIDGKTILPCGIVVRELEEPEPSVNYLTDSYHDLAGILPMPTDDDYVITNNTAEYEVDEEYEL